MTRKENPFVDNEVQILTKQQCEHTQKPRDCEYQSRLSLDASLIQSNILEILTVIKHIGEKIFRQKEKEINEIWKKNAVFFPSELHTWL